MAMLSVAPGMDTLSPSANRPVISLLAAISHADGGRRFSAAQAVRLLSLIGMTPDASEHQSLSEFAIKLLEKLEIEDPMLVARFVCTTVTEVRAPSVNYTGTTERTSLGVIPVNVVAERDDGTFADDRTPISLQVLLNRLYSETRIADGWRPDGHSHTTQGIQKDTIDIGRMGGTLFIDVARFNNSLQKVMTDVTIPETVSVCSAVFEPVAAAYHSGSISSGHYIAVVRTGSRWTLFNDGTQTPHAPGLASSPTLKDERSWQLAAVLLVRRMYHPTNIVGTAGPVVPSYVTDVSLQTRLGPTLPSPTTTLVPETLAAASSASAEVRGGRNTADPGLPPPTSSGVVSAHGREPVAAAPESAPGLSISSGPVGTFAPDPAWSPPPRSGFVNEQDRARATADHGPSPPSSSGLVSAPGRESLATDHGSVGARDSADAGDRGPFEARGLADVVVDFMDVNEPGSIGEEIDCIKSGFDAAELKSRLANGLQQYVTVPEASVEPSRMKGALRDDVVKGLLKDTEYVDRVVLMDWVDQHLLQNMRMADLFAHEFEKVRANPSPCEWNSGRC